MDILRWYSKKSSLGVDLRYTLDRLKKAQLEPPKPRRSVSSSGRVTKAWKIEDKLSEAQMIELVRRFESGTPLTYLAAEYGISHSSVKRLKRLKQVAQAMISRAAETKQGEH